MTRTGRGPGRGRVHPVGWFVPVMTSITAVLAWAAVAHSGGSGWVQAIGALLAAVLGVGLVAPAVAAHRASVMCRSSPADAQAGRPATVTLLAGGPLRVTPRLPPGPPARAAGPASGPREVEIEITPQRRGVIVCLRVEVASCAPFGLLWWAKEVEVALPRDLHVAPRYAEAGAAVTLPDRSAGEALARVPAGVGEPRGVRPYVSGDTRGSVHWPATAHVGSLMVREKERPTNDPLVVDLVLPPDPDEAERLCEQAMTAVAGHMARGRRVLLGTDQPDGRHIAVVRDRIDLGRRLAVAVPPTATAPIDGRRPR